MARPQNTSGNKGLVTRLVSGLGRVLGITTPGRSGGARLANLLLVALLLGGAVYTLRSRQAKPAAGSVAESTPAAPVAGQSSTDAKPAADAKPTDVASAAGQQTDTKAAAGDAPAAATPAPPSASPDTASDSRPASQAQADASATASTSGPGTVDSRAKPDDKARDATAASEQKPDLKTASDPKPAGDQPGKDAAVAPAPGGLFRDTRDLDDRVKAAGPAPTPSATASAPSGGLFRDARPIAEAAPAGGTIAPTALAPTTQAPAASAPAGPSVLFRDARPLADADTPAAAPGATPPTATAATGLFRDSRTLTGSDGKPADMFKDPRGLAAPSFRDDRPVIAAPEAPSPAAAAAPSLTVAAAAPPSPPAAPAATAAAQRPAPAPGPTTQPAATSAQPAAAATAATAAEPAATAPALPTMVAVNAPPIRVDAGACTAPELTAEPLDGGRMRILVNASCRAGEAVQLSYGGAELIRKLDAFGRLDFVLDCFAGSDGAVLVRFADGSQQSLAVATRDLDKVSKFAVVWHAPVNLDLHVFEYAARYDQPGHVWAKSASSLPAARALILGDRRGHGFLSSSDDEGSLGDKVEVYTFLHSDEQTSGAISLALDYETRGEMPTGATCGQGALAEIDFQIVMLPRGGKATRQPGVLTRVDCGRRIAREARLNQSALPGLRIRR